jgi:primosomal protein N' (replication factor Y)
LKHRKAPTVAQASNWLAIELRKSLGERVLGPAIPSIHRVRLRYVNEIVVKIFKEKDSLSKCKTIVTAAIEKLWKQKQYRSVVVLPDVDPF